MPQYCAGFLFVSKARQKEHIVEYVPFGVTRDTDKKTSKMGDLFLSESQSNGTVLPILAPTARSAGLNREMEDTCGKTAQDPSRDPSP